MNQNLNINVTLIKAWRPDLSNEAALLIYQELQYKWRDAYIWNKCIEWLLEHYHEYQNGHAPVQHATLENSHYYDEFGFEIGTVLSNGNILMFEA